MKDVSILEERIKRVLPELKETLHNTNTKKDFVIKGVTISREQGINMLEEFEKFLNSPTSHNLNPEIIPIQLCFASEDWCAIQAAQNGL